MARYKCPCCSAAFNGKRCRNCYYEVFTEEITHGLHIHTGEPLVINTPVRRPIKRKDPFDCDRKTRRRPTRLLGIILAVVITLAGFVGEVIETVMEDFADVPLITPEPEPEIIIPESTVLLYDANNIQVAAAWQDGMPYMQDIPVYLTNNTGKELNMSARDVTVNGYVMEAAYLYSSAENGKTDESHLRIYEEELAEAGIETVAEISFYLEFYDSNSYETIAQSDYIRFYPDAPENFTQPANVGGALLWDNGSVKVVFKGYKADDYHTEEFLEGTLQFYIENASDRYLQIYTQDASINQETADLTLWCELKPNTRIITDVHLYWLEGLGLDSMDDIDDLTLTLGIDDREGSDYFLSTGPLSVDIAK